MRDPQLNACQDPVNEGIHVDAFNFLAPVPKDNLSAEHVVLLVRAGYPQNRINPFEEIRVAFLILQCAEKVPRGLY